MYYSPAETRHTDDVAVLRNYVDTIKARQCVSQRDQAAALGVGWTTYRDWLNGNAKWPKTAQMALEAWAFAALPEDEYGIGERCCGMLTLEEERALVTASKVLADLDNTVRDWQLPELLDFARHGAQHVTFKAVVDGYLIDQASGERLELGLSEPGQKALYEHAYAVCQRAVQERMADLLDA
jgi:hypothetical protein